MKLLSSHLIWHKAPQAGSGAGLNPRKCSLWKLAVWDGDISAVGPLWGLWRKIHSGSLSLAHRRLSSIPIPVSLHVVCFQIHSLNHPTLPIPPSVCARVGVHEHTNMHSYECLSMAMLQRERGGGATLSGVGPCLPPLRWDLLFSAAYARLVGLSAARLSRSCLRVSRSSGSQTHATYGLGFSWALRA